MYITRMFINKTCSKAKQNIRIPESMHKTVMSLFPANLGDTPRKAHNILYRLDKNQENNYVLLIQSQVFPDISNLPSEYFTDFSYLSLNFDKVTNGSIFSFRLKANTTKDCMFKDEAGNLLRKHKRIPLKGDEAKTSWLARKAENNGFKISTENLFLQEVDQNTSVAYKNVKVTGTQFDGVLKVIDKENFIEALKTGVGPAKAYGFGLLSIRSVYFE